VSYSVRRSEQTWFRLIPSRFPPVDVYERLGEPRLRTAAQQIEVRTNPRLASKARIAHEADADHGGTGRLQNWNHAPFAYKNPEGSYLLSPAYGVMEVVGDSRSALAFYLRRREVFLDRTDETAMALDMRMLHTPVRGNFADLAGMSPELAKEARWAIGRELYESGVSGAFFQRADYPSTLFLAIFDPSVLEPSQQGAHYRFVWDGTAIRSIYDFGTGKEIMREELLGDGPDKRAA
jgi:hypothetical protein